MIVAVTLSLLLFDLLCGDFWRDHRQTRGAVSPQRRPLEAKGAE
jgi:hypothetical protein